MEALNLHAKEYLDRAGVLLLLVIKSMLSMLIHMVAQIGLDGGLPRVKKVVKLLSVKSP
jgi:hypothetical protein